MAKRKRSGFGQSSVSRVTMGDRIHVAYNGSKTITTGSLGTSTGYKRQIPSYTDDMDSAPAGAVVAAQYGEGVFSKSYAKWVPSVGMTTAGRVWLAYIENPETIVSFEGYSEAQKASFIKGVANVKCGSIYRELRLDYPGSRRRKAYDTNWTNSAGSADLYDRCCQGAVIWLIEGAPATTVVGTMFLHDELTLVGLRPNST